MSLALKTPVTNKSLGQSVPKIDAIVQQLKDFHGLILKGETAKRQAVTAVEAFLKKNVQGPNRTKTLDAICNKAGVTGRTYNRWKEEMDARAEIGSAVFEEAQAHGIFLTASSIKVLADTKRLNPGATPEQIVWKAKSLKSAHRTTHSEKVKLDTRELLVNALNDHFAATSAESVSEVILKSRILREPLCKACKGMTDVK